MSKKISTLFVILLAAALVLAACGADQPAPEAAAPVEAATEAPVAAETPATEEEPQFVGFVVSGEVGGDFSCGKDSYIVYDPADVAGWVVPAAFAGLAGQPVEEYMAELGTNPVDGFVSVSQGEKQATLNYKMVESRLCVRLDLETDS